MGSHNPRPDRTIIGPGSFGGPESDFLRATDRDLAATLREFEAISETGNEAARAEASRIYLRQKAMSVLPGGKRLRLYSINVMRRITFGLDGKLVLCPAS